MRSALVSWSTRKQSYLTCLQLISRALASMHPPQVEYVLFVAAHLVVERVAGLWFALICLKFSSCMFTWRRWMLPAHEVLLELLQSLVRIHAHSLKQMYLRSQRLPPLAGNL